MNTDYPTHDVPASPEYILEVLRDSHRQQCEFDPEADPTIKLSFESTIAEWREACDLVMWRKLALCLNREFKTDFELEHMRAVLESEKKKTLRDVCALVATKAKRPEIRPFGPRCDSAGAFLTIRSMLAQAGNKAKIKPSTPAAQFFKDYLTVFLTDVSRLEPGALPLVKMHHPFYFGSMIGFVIGLIVLMTSCFTTPGVAIFGVCITAFSYALMWIAAHQRPIKVEFGAIKTFGELAQVIANTRENRMAARHGFEP
jgi:hypothetical protein